MGIRVRDSLTSGLGEVRYEPTARRIRAKLGADTVVDSTRAVLLWEPRRIVPTYAVPIEDVRGELTPVAAASAADSEDVGFSIPELSRRPVLDPSVPFAVHTVDGEVLDLGVAGLRRPGAGFRLTDPDLAAYVVLDFAAFDTWYEEDEVNVGHPRDPFHRIDVLASSRHVRLELDGAVLAESSRPTLLFEAMLPTRFYLPREDVRAELIPSDKQTVCAYKGQASYLSPTVAGQVLPDLAWTYEQPQHDAARVRGLIAFFDERVDVELDGVRQERPVTPWSARPGG